MAKSVLLAGVLVACLPLSGCKSSNVEGVPEGAKLVQESSSSLTFTAANAGAFFIRDQPANQIIYNGPIDAGQKVVIDAKNQRVTLDGHPLITTAPLRPDGTYQVFFQSIAVHSYHPMMNP